MTHYLALTLGPIYATLAQARKTRELWAASYLFSALMRELVQVLRVHPKVEHILSPVVDTAAPRHGAGIYPDRCFAALKAEIDGKEVQQIIDAAIEAADTVLRLGQADYLKRYLRIYAATWSNQSSGSESPILALNRLLDALELQLKIPPGDEENLVFRLDSEIQALYADGNSRTGNSIFIRFDDDRQMRLPSLIELSSGELRKRNPETYVRYMTAPTNAAILDYQKILRTAKNELDAKRKARKAETANEETAVRYLKQQFGSDFKFRHKYVCFVKADGDNMGKLLASIGSGTGQIKTFSSTLAAFAQSAVDRIVAFGGIPVYAGGDDLLFVAPLQNEQQVNIFTLLSELKALFDADTLDKIAPAERPEDKPSLSIGLSISYYKYPMAESLDAMEIQLRDVAKRRCGKNAIAFRVLKHSGQPFGAVYGQDGLVAASFDRLLKTCQSLEQSFLTSVMHRLTELKPLLGDALQHGLTEPFFKHHFNESVHAESAYIDAVHALAKAAWQENPGDIETTVNQVYAILRFVQFLNQEDHD